MLEAELGGRCTARNNSVTLKNEAASSAVAIRAAIAKLRSDGRPAANDLAALADPSTEGQTRVRAWAAE